MLIIFLKSHVETYSGIVFTRIRGGLLLTILEKQLSFEYSTSSIHSSGSIANYLQVDIEKGVGMFEVYIELVSTSSKIFFSLYLVFKAIGLYLTAISFIIFLGCTLLALILIIINFKVTLNFLSAKDKRVLLIKSALKNIMFVKSKTLEYFYHYKIYFSRQTEIGNLRYTFYL